eukprot:jgi/Ulvmu1/10497/UM064_0035.1
MPARRGRRRSAPRPSVNSPGDAIIALARQAIPVLENVTHALFHAFLSRDYQKATLMD